MKRRIELHPNMNNVLELSEPGAYQCRVVGYLLERSLLVVKVARPQQEFFVVFPDVHHYNGTFLWQGALLRVASNEEHFDYMLDRSIVTALGLLFIFDSADGRINLLGGDWIAIFDELPDRFR